MVEVLGLRKKSWRKFDVWVCFDFLSFPFVTSEPKLD